MKNGMKKGIAFVLALIMLASLSLGIFAEEQTEYEHFDSIFSIGDSHLMGFGLPGYRGNPSLTGYFPESEDYTMDPEVWLNGGAEGSFPYEVMTALGLTRENAYNLHCPGLRAKDAYWLLNGEGVTMEGDRYFEKTGQYHMKQILEGGSPKKPECDVGVRDVESMNNYILNLKEKEGDRKLVLLCAGASDIFFSTVKIVTAELGIEGGGSSGLSFDNLDLTGAVDVLLSTIWENYNSFRTYVPKLIERVQELNPSAKLMLIGTFNPLKDLKIDDDGALPILEAFAMFSDLVNESFRSWAKEYGAVYVDITNVETGTLGYGITLSNVFETNIDFVYHATPEGYKYIARQILSKLRTDDTPARDLEIDLGSVSEIHSVWLGGRAIEDYSFNPESHTLIIPNDGLLPFGTLTVTEMREDEETGESSRFLVSYSVQWDFANREWTARRIFTSQGVGAAHTLLAGLVVALWKSLTARIGSIFSR